MTTTPPIFCFVIPCFNEEDNVGPTVTAVAIVRVAQEELEA